MSDKDEASLKYYKELEKQDNNAKKVGWKNDYAQQIRFEQLLKLLDERSNFSLNDLGCGLGGFYDFLNERGHTNFKYYGYDIFEEMISSAKNLHSSQDVNFMTIASSEEILEVDYTIASGIFNLKHSKSEAEWLSYILKELEIMDRKSKKGFAFNMLTKYSDKEYMRQDLYYTDPSFIFDYCMRNFSRNVALLHDYREYDFTIIVRK